MAIIYLLLLQNNKAVSYYDNLMLVLSFYAACFNGAPNTVPEIW